MASKGNDTLLVAAIDFGTTYSGYAFSFRKTPLDIQSPQTWYAGSGNVASLKTSTCLLIQPEKDVLFGYKAEDEYAELSLNNQHDDCYFFQHFKMVLYENKNLSKSTTVEDISGKSMSALKVFALSIEYFKKHLMGTLNMRSTGINLEDVHFVITVPAIWTDSAKQFMREAATEAGLDNSRISLALEPEAASVFCQQIPVDKFQSSDKLEIAKAGTEYMVVDLGGGTVDISVHRKEVDGSLDTLHAATGGPWGGQMVNREYMKILENIFGKNTIEIFRKEEMGDYFEIMRGFETKKRTIQPEQKGNIFIGIPTSLREIHKNQTGETLEEAIKSSRYSDNICLMRDKLKIDFALIKQLFEPSVSSIIMHVSNILQEPEMQNVSQILLVGGYSECHIIHHAFKEEYGEKRIIIPNNAGLVVVNGSVYLSHNPLIISTRVLSYTYGISIDSHFEEGIHPENRKYTDEEGTVRCKNCFYCFVHAGDKVKTGKAVSKPVFPLTKSKKRVGLCVFQTSDSDPKYVTDEGCVLLGKFSIDLPPFEGNDRSINVDFVFGDTEFKVEATVEKTGIKSRKYFSLPE